MGDEAGLFGKCRAMAANYASFAPAVFSPDSGHFERSK
jgi:hypothetical protein